jgi:hypothetical protein
MSTSGFSAFNLKANCEDCGQPINFNLTVIYSNLTGGYKHITCPSKNVCQTTTDCTGITN